MGQEGDAARHMLDAYNYSLDEVPCMHARMKHRLFLQTQRAANRITQTVEPLLDLTSLALCFPLPQDMSYGRIKSLVGEELKSYFRPEFLNRLDEIIVFRQLTKKEVKQIADIFLRDVFKRAEEKGIKIEVNARAYLIDTINSQLICSSALRRRASRSRCVRGAEDAQQHK